MHVQQVSASHLAPRCRVLKDYCGVTLWSLADMGTMFSQSGGLEVWRSGGLEVSRRRMLVCKVADCMQECGRLKLLAVW